MTEAMTEEEIRVRAEQLIQAPNLSGHTYDEVVKILTVA
jgi:hypothetical protein